VATWNLWWRFGPDPDARFAGIETALQHLQAEVICLQEVYRDRNRVDDAHRLGRLLGLHAESTTSHRNAEHLLGNAILSKWPIGERGEESLPDAGGRAGHRTALWAVLRTPFGPLPVISTHLAYRFDESAVRQQQLRVVAALAGRLRPDGADGPPVLLGGDLNAVPDSDEIRLITGRSAPPVPGLVFNDCWP
jgi:endonuclease/exonuclease/phosphatase family metal-dependent hydrolase